MTYKQTSRIMDILFGIAAIIAIIGLVLKILEVPHSNIFLIIGLCLAALLGFNEIKRLKKVIDVLKKTLH